MKKEKNVMWLKYLRKRIKSKWARPKRGQFLMLTVKAITPIFLCYSPSIIAQTHIDAVESP